TAWSFPWSPRSIRDLRAARPARPSRFADTRSGHSSSALTFGSHAAVYMSGVVGRVGKMRAFAISAAVAALVALALGAGAASVKKSCGDAIIQDWYVDQSIDGTYSSHCYKEALSRVSDAMRIYSSLPDELESGLRAALAREATSGRLGTTHTIGQPSRSTQ